MMTLETVGRCSSQLSAICGMVLPVSSATASRASMTRKRCASSTGGPRSAVWCRRLIFGQRLAPAELAGEPAPAERAPDQRADALVEAERHQLPLIVAAEQRVIDLMGGIARIAISLRDRQRFHQLPAGEVRDADIAELAGADEVVERREDFLDGRAGIEGMQLQQIDVVRAEPAQRRLARPRSAASARSRHRSALRPCGRLVLVEMITRSRRPLIAAPSTSSDAPLE